MDAVPLRHKDSALHRMFELADVPRPRVPEQGLYRIVCEALDRISVPRAMKFEKIQGERHDVVAPLSKRRQTDLDCIQAIQQILPELPGGHDLSEIRVGSRKNANVHLPDLGRADTLDLPGLEYAQKFRLPLQRDIRDLIEEERPLVRQLETSDSIGLGVRERPLHVPEELAFEHALGKTSRVDRHECVLPPPRHGMEPTRYDFLSRAMLAGDQHIGLRGPHPFHHPQNRVHDLGFRDEVRGLRATKPTILVLEVLAPSESPAQLDLGPQGLQEPLIVPRLLDVVPSAPAALPPPPHPHFPTPS